ncbi:SDR family NAD(P)-dependent oxidoreductase [Streptomyces mirabilis]|uniref:SDR family NAD(P)-dependent oxidoreductase n=1 Tax=Streptomyces mirabilis TaxID=68239 RepID=UPI0036B436D9
MTPRTSTPFTSPFTADSTAFEVIEGVDLAGRRAIVTGGASGLGIETARALAVAGAEVTLAVRDLAAGKRTAQDITADTGSEQVHVAQLDLTDLASVAAFTAAWDGPLHILVNNAGVMAAPETRTPEGWELQFATNHLGHFALATGLLQALAAAEGARVVAVSSAAHLNSPVVFDDIHFRERAYDPWIAYGQSKTANVLFAVEADKRWAADGITVNALHPGGILTNLSRHMDSEELERMAAASSIALKTPQQGAATSVLLAASPLVDGVGGRYFEDCNEAEEHQEGSRSGVARHAVDPKAAERLWEISLDAVLRRS